MLDTLLVRCSRSRDNKLNIQMKFYIKAHPSIILYSLNEDKIAKFVIQPQYKEFLKVTLFKEKVTMFKEFQYVTVARSLSDRFSYSPAIIDC